mgnify:CR=1 FL=1
MQFKESQKDMITAYYGGATGVLSSGIIWCIAGFVGIAFSNVASMAALFIGGSFIVPLSVLISKGLKRTGKHSNNNVLRHLAIEGLGILFVGLFLAYAMSQFNINLFYPVMLLVIGTRYLTFQTLYGLKLYWILGGTLILVGFALFFLSHTFIIGAFLGGVIEILFSLLIFKKSKVDI